MKALFYTGVIGLILFEILNVYFIMPMPGSQRMQSIDLAYFLHTWRWAFRIVFVGAIAAGILPTFRSQRWWVVGSLVVAAVVVYLFNFRMAADHMFYQPETLRLLDAKANQVRKEKLVVGIVINGQAKAYPIQLIGYHHQVRDTVGGKPVMVTYCTVCRTGRVFEPVVDGEPEQFRLVGMDHFNAMFEDATTGSWWRQATGEAITGQRKGKSLNELPSEQVTLVQWLAMYPNSLVMQPDATFEEKYKGMLTYEDGKGKSDLTRTDSLSWKDKSWVVGIAVGNRSKAFDWNRLKKEHLIHDTIGNQPVLVVLASDRKSFFAFERPDVNSQFSLKKDTLWLGTQAFSLNGKSVNTDAPALTKVNAYQEFWHSWQTFHPQTTR